MSLDLDKKVLIVIPSLEPEESFIKYVEELVKNNFENILLINDGSSSKCNYIFEKINSLKECTIINHEINEGKGKSLKDGLKYFEDLQNKDDFIGVITADCDGQHLVKDVISVAKNMKRNSNSLILGVRNFSDGKVPTRSGFGNKVTSNVFKILYGLKLSDTQTGLRGIPKGLVENFINLQGNRYEYEMNMLIDCALRKIKIEEVEIDTVYIDNNSSSHFRPIHDSLIIYWRILNSFIKYSAISIISCVVDVLFFKLFFNILGINAENIKIIVATIVARIISSLVNFGLNKKVAFKSTKNIKNTIIKYYILCIIQMIISGISVAVLYSIINISEVLIKIVVDTILFFINYRVQRIYIFNK